MLRDIRELADQQEAYADELRRRWGGLLSYRYIGRMYASMDPGPVDDTVTLRHDMRNPTGGLLLAVLGIAAPESGHMSDLEAVPNPVIHSCQILDPGRDVRRIEIVSEELKVGRQMGYSRAKDRRRRPARPGARADRGPGRQHRHAAGGARKDGGRPDRGGRLARSAAAVAGVRRPPPTRRALGAARSYPHEVASPDAALHIGPQFVILETAAPPTRPRELAGTDPLQGVRGT